MFIDSRNLFNILRKSSRYKWLMLHRGIKKRLFKGSSQLTSEGALKTLTYENQYTRLSAVVEPYWRMPYDKQLSIKKRNVEQSLQRVYNSLVQNKRMNIEDNNITRTMKEMFDGKMCLVKDVIPSPVIKGFRNKDLFAFGPDKGGDYRTLGYIMGRSDNNTLICIRGDFVNITKDKHKEVSKVLQEFIYQSKYDTWSYVNRHGNWKNITIRSTWDGQVMVIFYFNPQKNSKEFIDGAKNEIIQYFIHGPGQHLEIASIYFQSSRYREPSIVDPFELLHGTPYLTETILDLKFQISPLSFFQGNVPCAELLYTTALDIGNVGPSTVVLDICCGTGTIGIIAAKRAKKVIGVEILSQAVEDAKVNAQINGITNAEFVCNKAHRTIRDLVNSNNFEDENDVVAFLNPGRAGCNKILIESIRNCPKIKKIVYISCKPAGNVLTNFIDLIIPKDVEFFGEPFKPVVAIPVDMFPQTVHCEVIFYFER